MLGNDKSQVWKKEVLRMVHSFQKLKCSTSLELYLMDSQVEYFSENLGDNSEEQVQRFYQDSKVMEQWYEEEWDKNMMVDYCWYWKEMHFVNKNMKRKMALQKYSECKRVLYNLKKLFFFIQPQKTNANLTYE